MKAIPLFLIVLFSSFILKAQYEPINNDCLAEQLRIAYPNCISVDNQIDTTCQIFSTVRSIVITNCFSSGVDYFKLSSLRAFKNLDTLSLVFSASSRGLDYAELDVVVNFDKVPSSVKVLKLREKSVPFEYVDAYWKLDSMPNSIEALSGEVTELVLLNNPLSLKEIEVSFGGGLFSNNGKIIFPSEILPPNLESLVIANLGANFAPQVVAKLRKLHLIEVTNDATLGLNEFLISLPDGVEDIKITDLFNLQIPAKLPTGLKSLFVHRAKSTEINLPAELKFLYFNFVEGQINQLPNSLENLTMLNGTIPNPLTTFVSLPGALRNFELDRTPMLLVPDLPSGTVNFKATNAQIQTIGKLPSGLLSLNLGANDLRILPSLPARLRSLDVRGNPNLTCLPILNDSLRTLSTTFRCIPNESKYIKVTPNRPLCVDSDSICEDVAFVKGIMFYDENASGTLDSNELRLTEGMIKVQPNNVFAISGKDGAYSALLASNDTNFVSATYNNPYVESIAPTQYEIAASQEGFVFNDYHFAVRFRAANDLESYITSTTHRPGFSASVTAIITNRTISEYSNATLKLYCPTSLTKVATYPTADRIENDTIYWENISLQKFQTKKFELVVYNSPLSPLGTELTYTSMAESIVVDETPLNNKFEYKTIVRGSFDPNDKLVNVSTILPNYSADTELIYTIRFQNTGTDTAFTVVVKDSVLSTLNPESIRTISSSHDYVMDVNGDGVINFSFYNILLPDSSVNEALSHGYIMLALRPRESLPLGTKILNGASIYFDYNEPIITNIALTAVNTNVSTTIRKVGALKVYPNPTDQVISLENTLAEEVIVQIFDLNGREIYFSEVLDTIIAISVGDFPPGTYIIQTQSSSDISVGKFIVQK